MSNWILCRAASFRLIAAAADRPTLTCPAGNLHQSYDTLIIDTPALSLAQDSLLLAAQSDICLLVVKAGEQAARIRERSIVCKAPASSWSRACSTRCKKRTWKRRKETSARSPDARTYFTEIAIMNLIKSISSIASSSVLSQLIGAFSVWLISHRYGMAEVGHYAMIYSNVLIGAQVCTFASQLLIPRQEDHELGKTWCFACCKA
jgi:hypothetical protein